MIVMTPAQVHEMKKFNHPFIEDPADSCHECLVCNAFVTDLVDAWQTHEANIHWFAVNGFHATMEEQA